MAKLLIVDDEKTTRESLTEYIPWHTLKVTSVKVARNGVEALVLANGDPPDVLLTDVRMPKLDGIELATKIRNLYPSCKIIFLSGYADKDYLKKAIHLQAISYIEKPIDPEEVKKVVRSAVSLYEEECRRKEEQERTKRSLNEMLKLIRTDLARELVKTNMSIPQLRETFGAALPSFSPYQCFTAATVLINWKANLTDGEKESLKTRLLSTCSGCQPFDRPSSFVGFDDNERIIIVVARKTMKAFTNHCAAYRRLLDKLAESAAGSCTASIGIGVPVNGVQNIASSYASAVQSAGLQFYRGPGQLFFPAPPRCETFSVDAQGFTRFADILKDDDHEQAIQFIKEISGRAATLESTNIDSVRNVFFNLFLIIFEVAWNKKIINPFGDREKTYIWQEIREQATLSQLNEFIQSNLQGILAVSWQNADLPRRILEVQRYIRKNYSDANLSLQTIADHAGLSRTYLSALFKNCSGTNINDCITRFRIEKAMEILKEGRKKSYEVASAVGYHDANYFSTLFKKHVGCSPTEYRDRR